MVAIQSEIRAQIQRRFTRPDRERNQVQLGFSPTAITDVHGLGNRLEVLVAGVTKKTMENLFCDAPQGAVGGHVSPCDFLLVEELSQDKAFDCAARATSRSCLLKFARAIP